MNKQTSNDMMEREFDILQSIEGLQPPASLYNKILSRAEGQMQVSKKWITVAAALLALVLCVEVFIVLQPNEEISSSEISNLVQQENYQLYE